MSIEEPLPELNAPSSDMPGKLHDAAATLGMDGASSEAFSQTGAAVVNRTPLYILPLPTRVLTGFDGILVAPLTDLKLTQVVQAEVLLNANMALGPATGLNFSMMPDGDLQLTCGFRSHDVDGAWLANMMLRMSALVADVREDLATIAGPQAAVRTADAQVATW